jgi:hypothetical protein
MIRDPTKRVIEIFQQLMVDKTKHEDAVQTEDANKDLGAIANKSASAMIEEIRPALLNASEAAGELSPSRAICLGSLLDNMHRLDTNKLFVLKEVMSALLDSEVSQPEKVPEEERAEPDTGERPATPES